MRTEFLTLLSLAGAAAAQAPTFAPPVRLMAGDTMLGAGRLYPSPVCQDLDGDGRVDIVVGDLRGRLTVAKRTTGATFAKEEDVRGADGEIVDLHNW